MNYGAYNGCGFTFVKIHLISDSYCQHLPLTFLKEETLWNKKS